MGLDLVALESKDGIVLSVGLRSLADVNVESEDDEKDEDLDSINDLEVRVDISGNGISIVLSKFEDWVSPFDDSG